MHVLLLFDSEVFSDMDFAKVFDTLLMGGQKKNEFGEPGPELPEVCLFSGNNLTDFTGSRVYFSLMTMLTRTLLSSREKVKHNLLNEAQERGYQC